MAAKLDARKLPGFLAAPPGECRVVLLVGDDAGLITERAAQLIRAVAGEDRLCITEAGREALKDPASLANEAASARRARSAAQRPDAGRTGPLAAAPDAEVVAGREPAGHR